LLGGKPWAPTWLVYLIVIIILKYTMGMMSDELLQKIVDTIDTLHEDDSFDDWQ
jgi:hypothetical protein